MKRYAIVVLLFALWPAAAFADLEKGLVRFEQGDYDGAYRELKPSAESGDVRAQYVVGVMYLSGLGVEADDDRAHHWLRRAAEGGHVEAQVELARLYRDGHGVSRDQGRMVHWYQQAAAQGHVGAQLFVADAYAYGNGIEKDLVLAYVWYEVARQYWGDLAKDAQAYVADRLGEDQIDEAKRQAQGVLASMEP